MSNVDDIIRQTLVGLDQTLRLPTLKPVDRDLLRLHQAQVKSVLHEEVSAVSTFEWLRSGFRMLPPRPATHDVDVLGPYAPTSPGAAGIHPSQIPVDWREQLGWAHQVLTAALADHDAGRINLNSR